MNWALVIVQFLGCLCVAIFPAMACPICMGSRLRPPCFAEKVIQADHLVIARRADKGKLVVESTLRGVQVDPGTAIGLQSQALASRVLVTRREGDSEPTNLGPCTTDLLDFLRVILPLREFEPDSDAQWHEQLERLRPFLDDRDQRIAGSAWTAWAIAPYRVLRQHQPLPSRRSLLTWLDDDSRSGDASLHWTLLGLQADELVKERLRDSILAAWEDNETTHLAAMLDAEISANGAEALPFITAHYLDDRGRTLEEIRAALLAMRMHGHEGNPDLRDPIAEAFESFAVSRRPLSGLIASDLQAWKRWTTWRQYAAMLQSGEAIYPASRPAITSFLKACPEEGAVAIISKIQK